jgi:hypothetical protein
MTEKAAAQCLAQFRIDESGRVILRTADGKEFRFADQQADQKLFEYLIEGNALGFDRRRICPGFRGRGLRARTKYNPLRRNYRRSVNG